MSGDVSAGEIRPPALPRSEDLFLAWFFTLPENANVAEAAHREIARIDDAGKASGCDLQFRDLLRQATLNQPFMPRHRRRRRH